MAGHSKWANIKHRKAKQDAAKGKIFTKIIREIVSAAKSGDPDPATNPRLRAVLEKANAANMTKDVIKRAIERGAGGGDNDNMDEITYEGYGAGGVAVIVETMTDNLNRTVGEVRHAFAKHGGNLGTTGSVAYLFNKQGEIVFSDLTLEDRLMELTLEAGADDIANDNESLTIITSPANFGAVMDALTAADLKPDHAEVTMSPTTIAPVDDLETAERVIKMIEMLEELDDVQEVYSNAQFSDAVMAQL